MNGFNLSNIQDAKLGSTQVSALYYGSQKLWPLVPELEYYKYTKYEKEYLTIEMLANSSYISIGNSGSSSYTSPSITVYSSLNGGTWVEHVIPERTTNQVTPIRSGLKIGDKVRIKANLQTWGRRGVNYSSRDHYIYLTSNCKIYGNINSLIKGDNFYKNYNITDVDTCGLFAYVFNGAWSSNNNTIKDVSNLYIPAYKFNSGSVSTNSSQFKNSLADNKSITEAPMFDIYSIGNDYFRYYNTFMGCSALTNTDNIDFYSANNITLGYYGFAGFFANCASLLKGPRLSFKTSTTGTFDSFFSGCTSLTDVEVNMNSFSNSSFSNFVNNTTNLTTIKTNNTTITGSNLTVKTLAQSNIHDPLLFTIESLDDNNVITYNVRSNYRMYWNVYVNGVKTKSNWAGINGTNTLGTLQKGDIIQIEQNTSEYYQPCSTNGNSQFSSTGKCRVYGHLMSIVTNGYISDSIQPTYSSFFSKLFKDWQYLIDARNLILPTLYNMTNTNIFESMFEGCINLQRAPRYIYNRSQRDSYYNYQYMFKNCENLIEGPEILYDTHYNVNTIRDLYYMFYNCAKLEYVGLRYNSLTITYKYEIADWLYGVNASNLVINSNVWTLQTGDTPGTYDLTISDRETAGTYCVPIGATLINNKFIYANQS